MPAVPQDKHILSPKMESKRKFKVLVSDSVDSAGIDILSAVATVDVRTKLNEDELCETIGDYDALMVRSGTQVTKRIIEAGKKLKIVGRAGVGVDNVDVRAATDQGIFVVNSPQGNTVAAAEHTLGLMFALSRHVAAADASIRSGLWDRSNFMGSQLQHKTLGIIGLGQVGGHVARVAREMGMKLVCYDPFVNAQRAASLGCRIASLEELLQQSDFVTLHVPLIEQTKDLINKERISLMKNTARIINCSRGGVINEKDLCEALTSGRLAGAALDVFEVEKPMDADSILLRAPRLLLTPHLGASTNEAQVNVAVDVAQQIKQTLLGSLPMSAVNIPGIRTAELEDIRPLLFCCDTLGRLAIRLLSEAVESIRVTLEGDFSEHTGEPLLLAVTNGVLSLHTTHRVNFVNVRQVAERHRVNLKVVKESFHPRAAIKVELENSNEVASVAGTIMEDGQVVLLALNGVPIYMLMPESTPESPISIFYSKHNDTPGTLSKITAKLGEAKVNIANCHLGRICQNGKTMGICVFHVDGVIDEKVLDTIRQVDCVFECKIIDTTSSMR